LSIEKERSFDYIKSISRTTAIQILIELCEDGDIFERILSRARESLTSINAKDVEEEVFRSLNSIQIEDLWNNAGETYWGYKHETEVAYEMLMDSLEYSIQRMKHYKELDLKREEKECCKGIIAGLLRYGAEGNNEFHEAVPDDPYIQAENILFSWKEQNTDEDYNEVKEIYDSFFVGSDDEPLDQGNWDEYD